jgi:hypothetical protein
LDLDLNTMQSFAFNWAAIVRLSLVFPCFAGNGSAVGAAPGVDLLSAPLESARPYRWKVFAEGPPSEAAGTWTLREEGVLVCRGTPKGYLYLDHKFTDFVLRLEWRWPAGKKPGNAGVLFRITGPDKIWPRSLEAQINAGQAGDFWGLDGFDLKGSEPRMKVVESPQFGRLTNLRRTADRERPEGEWNEYEIVARGSTVTLRVNGEEVNRATGCDVVAGRICLTAEGDEIHFRRVRLEPLAPAGGAAGAGRVVTYAAAAVMRMEHEDEHTLRLTLDGPRKFSLEPEGKRGPLLLFANPLETDAPRLDAAGVIHFWSRHSPAGQAGGGKQPNVAPAKR